jgi:hypothetical protein
LPLHPDRLGEFLDPLNPHVTSFLEQARAFVYQQTGNAARPQQMAVQSLEDLRQQQVTSLAYFDVFWVSAVVGMTLVFLVLLMKELVKRACPGRRDHASASLLTSSFESGPADGLGQMALEPRLLRLPQARRQP